MEFDELNKYALSAIQAKKTTKSKDSKNLDQEIVDFILGEKYSS